MDTLFDDPGRTFTSSLVTLTLHAYMGMIEYNTLVKGTRTLGAEIGQGRFSAAFNGIAAVIAQVQEGAIKRASKEGGTPDSRMFLWRALPYVLHYAYRGKAPYVVIEKHFPIGRKYDDGNRFDLSELRNEKNYAVVSALAPKTGMWGDYCSFIPSDRIWLPNYSGAKRVFGLSIEQVADFMLDHGCEVLSCAFPYEGKVTARHFGSLLATDDLYFSLLGLMLACFYTPEIFAETGRDKKRGRGLTSADLYGMYRSDLWVSQYQGLIAEYGFRALYKSRYMPYVVRPIEFPQEEGGSGSVPAEG